MDSIEKDAFNCICNHINLFSFNNWLPSKKQKDVLSFVSREGRGGGVVEISYTYGVKRNMIQIIFPHASVNSSLID